MTHDVSYWDERYAEAGGDKHEHSLAEGPDPTVVEVVSGLTPGRALDVAAGRGRHALCLAAQGWQVTAVDWSEVGIDEGRAAETAVVEATLGHPRPEVASLSGKARAPHQPITWVVADVTTWEPEDASYDLVVCAFVHLDLAVFRRVRTWLAPGGQLVVLGHALRNLTDGVGGPSDPTYLHTEDQLSGVAEGLTVERLGEVVRQTDHGPQIDLVLIARN